MALHELRAPLTTVAYASELLLDSPRPSLPPATHRRHLESIHQSAADASSILSLFSRFIEVEHAGESPRREPVPAEVFRDPRATTPGPETPPANSLIADPRLARHLATTLWELADLHPAPRPILCSFLLQENQIALLFENQGPLHSLLFPAATSQKTARRKQRGALPSPLPFTLSFRVDILRRAIFHLGGSLTSVHSGPPARFQIALPLLHPDSLPAVSEVRSQP